LGNEAGYGKLLFVAKLACASEAVIENSAALPEKVNAMLLQRLFYIGSVRLVFRPESKASIGLEFH
jgi:hypothetical protein